MGEPTPPFVIPEEGRNIWNIFGKLNNSIFRVKDGFFYPLPPSECSYWFNLSGVLVTPKEYDIIQAMDLIYCEEMNKEIKSQRSRREEEHRQQMQAAQSKQRVRKR